MVICHFVFLSVITKHRCNLQQFRFAETAQHAKSGQTDHRCHLQNTSERTTAAVISHGCVACRGRGRQTLPSFLPFIMLTPSSDTKKGDSSNTCWTWGKEGETGERKGDLSATRSKRKQQWDGLNVIYCNGSSSRGALRLKGLIISPGGD